MAELGLISDGAVLVAEGKIVAAGTRADVLRAAESGHDAIVEHDCGGRLVTPGLVDSHTHMVFTAPRLDDYERRLAGKTYAEIAAAGGGIQTSLTGVRAASDAELTAAIQSRLNAARRLGSTTVEVKSGYGLSPEAERKSLRAAAAAARATGIDAPLTYLGAHIVPPGVARAAYVAEVCTELAKGLGADVAPEFADVFCDTAGFTLAESRRILEAARARGLKLKLHAEQFAHSGGCALGVELGAVSVDHLDAVDARDVQLLAASETVATLIPGANMFLGQPYPDARRLIAAGVAVALATDFNPGTCPIQSLPLVMSLACSGMRMSPAEAWTAVTINGAAALDRAAVCGSLMPGKRADLVIFDADDYRAVPYYAGSNLCRAVVHHGEYATY
jgi:imidazolonepropionase